MTERKREIEKKNVEPWPVWLGWLEHCPLDQEVTHSIPGQGTHPGFGIDPQSGHVRESNQVDISVSCQYFSLSFREIKKMSLGKDKKMNVENHIIHILSHTKKLTG